MTHPKLSALPATTVPWLPPEIVFQILSEVWEASHTVKSRAILFRDMCLVNSTWLGLFARVALRHVHLPCPLDGDAYLRILQDRTYYQDQDDLFTSTASQVANDLCRSITFHVDGRASLVESCVVPSIKVYSDNDAGSNTVSQVLYMVNALEHLPNLRHLSLRYVDWGYDDIFDQFRSAEFPPQVTHLSVDYTFTEEALVALAVYLTSLYTPKRNHGVKVPGVRHLSLAGVPAEVIWDMLQVCSNVETLEITSPTRLYMLAPMPPSVHTLVLNNPGVMLRQEEMYWWTLNIALEAGLFTTARKPQIVVRSGTPDPEAFMLLKRQCKRYGVNLVFERADICE